MNQNLTISATGLKLIKAFEGFRSVDRELINGQRVVGYGHRLYSEDAVIMNKAEASEVLLSDLAPFEDMINSEVHAPISQSQFDALCSFAFNIGPKAFLQSDTLRAINNGRPLDAANSMDVWRKSMIDGKTYVVDALMRRRTAEKALFLRTDRAVPAGREDLRPVKDKTLSGLSTDDALPVLTVDGVKGIVATAPFEMSNSRFRRREDGLAGALQLSERDVIEDEISDEIESDFIPDESIDALAEANELAEDTGDIEPETPTLEMTIDDTRDETLRDEDLLDDVPFDDVAEDIKTGDIQTEDIQTGDIQDETSVNVGARKSPIAAAATDIVARLDALIEDVDAEFEASDDSEEVGDKSAQTEMDSDNLLIDEESQADGLADSLLDEIFEDEAQDNVIDLNAGTVESSDLSIETLEVADIEGDDLTPTQQEAMLNEVNLHHTAHRERTDSAAKYIEKSEPVVIVEDSKKRTDWGLGIVICLGFILIGLAYGAMIRGSEILLGEWGSIITFTGIVIGLGLILSGVYAALRIKLSR